MGIQVVVPPEILAQTCGCVILGLPSCIFVSHLNTPLLSQLLFLSLFVFIAIE